MFKKNFKAIFVISGVLASVWKVFIKFHWHGQNTIYTCMYYMITLIYKKLDSWQTDDEQIVSVECM